mgnify:CR=1 FL=1
MALKYLHTTDDGWRLFKNADWFIEGFKGIGKKIVNDVVTYKDHKHIVSNQTTIEFCVYIDCFFFLGLAI